MSYDVNYCALALAILSRRFTAETALDYICGGRGLRLTDDDTAQMLKFREQGMMYKDIGKIYNVNEHVVYKRIKRYKEARV